MSASDKRAMMRALAQQMRESGYSRPARRTAMAGADADVLAKRLSEAGGPWYHGTVDREFTRFDPRYAYKRGTAGPRGGGSVAGVFFTNSKPQAHNFRRLALKYGPGGSDKHDGRVIEAMIRGRFKAVDVPSLERRASSRGAENPYALGKQRDWMLRETASARREGYDGVDFVDILDDPLSSKHRATHRVVFPDRLDDSVDILHSHVLAPSGVLENTIAAARASMARRAPPRPRTVKVKAIGPY